MDFDFIVLKRVGLTKLKILSTSITILMQETTYFYNRSQLICQSLSQF